MWSQAKYLVPNSFTAFSMVLGMASIVCAATGRYDLGAWMVLWGVLLDKLDGAAARLLGASSKFGAELDSFADFVSFGIAPAALIFFRLHHDPLFSVNEVLLAGCCGLYTVALASRLARFNATTPPGGDKVFYGIPSTLCGAIVTSAYLSIGTLNLPSTWLVAAPLVLAVLGVLMVSNVRLPKLQMRRNVVINAIQMVNIAAVYIVTPMRRYPEYLFVLAIGYMVLGVAWAMRHPPTLVEDDEIEGHLEEHPTAS